jgi:hypothetical protein
VGTRNAASGAPTGITTDSEALANWRDIRSGAYVGSSNTLTAALALAPNASFARWDLVYAAVTPDTNGPSVARRVKNPLTGAISAPNVPEYILTTVTVAVVTGTSLATPPLPALPADGAGIYYIPLAYVYVPNGFGSSSTVLTKNIRATTQNVSGYANLSESFDCAVANGNNDENLQFNAGGEFPWNATGARPGPWMPPDWTGGKMLVAQVDNLSSPTYSHANGGIVDSSIDWRKRLITVVANYGTDLFGTDPAATAPVFTTPRGSLANTSIALGNSLVGQTTLLGNSATTLWSATVGGVVVALMVMQGGPNPGALVWTNSAGAPAARFAFMIFATGQMANF